MELGVVLAIVTIFLMLLVPMIRDARGPAKRSQCLNNIRNVTLAALNSAIDNSNRLPASGYYLAAGDAADGSLLFDVPGRSWAVDLLPYLDQQATYQSWNQTLPYSANSTIDEFVIDTFVCPESPSFRIPGAISYVCNSGFGDRYFTNDSAETTHSFLAEPVDWDGDGNINRLTITDDQADAEDREITRATGVFWPVFATWKEQSQDGSAAVDSIYDGSGNTIMFGENVNAGSLGWGHPAVGNTSFIFPVEDKAVNGTLPNSTNFGSAPDYIMRDPASNKEAPAYPNRSRQLSGVKAPYLNSQHSRVIVVSFCDGSAKTLSDTIDPLVYARLITPDGTRLRNIDGGGAFASESPLNGEF